MALIEANKPDNLIASTAHTAAVQTVTVLAGEGDLKRGTVLARNNDDKFEVLDTDATGKAEVILASDTDASGASDVIAEAYVSGDFVEGALIVDDGYAITEADRLNLKNAGIYLIAGLN